jgi:hypothetical protein
MLLLVAIEVGMTPIVHESDPEEKFTSFSTPKPVYNV